MTKRTLLIIAFLLTLSTFASAQKTPVRGFCEKGGQAVTISGITSTTKWQQSFPSCVVTVFNFGTVTPSTIYSDTAGTPKSNPFTAASTGLWEFFANSGNYTVQISSGGLPSAYSLGDYAVGAGGSGSGTVTSVALSGGTTGITIGGSPITTSGTFTLSGTLVPANGGVPFINLESYGAKLDGRLAGDGSCTASSANLLSAGLVFTAADVGKVISAQGCGAAGANLVTTISAFIDSANVTLAAAASTTLSPANVYLGTDDTSAWNAAIAAAGAYGTSNIRGKGLTGKTVITSKITIGDGSTTLISTTNGLHILGNGGGRTQITFNGGPSEIWFISSSSTGPVFQVEGPYSDFVLSGWFANLKVGSVAASSLVVCKWCHRTTFEDLAYINHSGWGIDLDTRVSPITGANVGGDDNQLRSIWAGTPSSTTGGGARIGAADSTSGPTSRIQIQGSAFYSGTDAASAGLNLRYGDANTLSGITTFSQGSGKGILVSAAPSNSAYPSAIACYGCALQGGTSVSGTWGPLDKIQFWPYSVADAEPVPTDTGFSGVTTRNLFFGAFTHRDVLTLQSNLSLTGAGKFISGDFSSGTDSARVLFKSTTAANTYVGVISNGATSAGFRAYSGSNPDQAATFTFYMNGTFNAAFESGHTGGATAAPITFLNEGVVQGGFTSLNHFVIGPGTTGDFGFLTVAGNIATALVAKTANYTVTDSDSTVTGDATGGAFNVTLLTAAGHTGRVYTVKRINSGANAVTVNTTSAQTIEGAATYALTAQFATVTVQSNGTNWIILNSITSGGSSVAGGSNTQIQYNNSGVLGGVSGFTTDGTSVTAGSGNLIATRPKFVTSIDDTNGNEVIKISATGSAVNELTITNAATAGSPKLAATGDDTNITLMIDSKGIGIIQFDHAAIPKVVTLTDATTVATDASLGNAFSVTLGGNRILGNPTNPTNGQIAVWEFIQDGTGSRTITLDTQFALGTDITAVTLTTAANKRDYLTAKYNSTATKWYVIQFVKGY